MPAKRKRFSSKLIALVVAAGFSLVAVAPAGAGPAGTGSISGTVQGGLGVPAESCHLSVTAYNSQGLESGFDGPPYYYPEGPFDFMIDELPPDSYRLKFHESCLVFEPSFSWVLLDEYFRDGGSLETADPISVAAGSVRTVQVNLSGTDPEITAPDTFIDFGPTGTITTDEATFGFSSSDPANTGKFDCWIDSGELADSTSPTTFSSLGDGPHTVSVRAHHAVAGHEDESRATRTFTVDVPNPEATIDKVSVKGPAKVKKGKKVTFRVEITNSGEAEATGVKLKVKGRGASLSSSLGKIPAGTTRTVKVKLKPRKAGKGMLTFKASSTNAGGKSVKRGITVK